MRGHLAFFMFAIVATGCSRGRPTEPNLPFYVGIYALASVNDGGLPAQASRTVAGPTIIRNGTLILSGDNSYERILTLSPPVSEPSGSYNENGTPAYERGTFAVVGTRITFTISAGGGSSSLSYAGVADGEFVTYPHDGVSYKYKEYCCGP